MQMEDQPDLSVFSYPEAVGLLARNLKPNYEERIVDAFAVSLGRFSAGPIWRAVQDRIESIPTRRKVRGVWKEIEGLSQEQAADQVGRTQSTLSKWLRGGEGSGVWPNMALAMTAFGVDLDGIQLPELNRRFVEAFRGCLHHIRKVEFGERGSAYPDADTVECLAVQYSEDSLWFSAKEETDEQVQGTALADAAERMARIADEQCGRRVRVRTRTEFSKLESEWGAAWVLSTSVIRLRWEGRHERYR